MTRKFFKGILEPPIVSYFKTIQCYSHFRYLGGFKTAKTWKNNQKTDFFVVSPWDTDISKILIWFTYTKKLGCYVKHTLRKYLSTIFYMKLKLIKVILQKIVYKLALYKIYKNYPIVA